MLFIAAALAFLALTLADIITDNTGNSHPAEPYQHSATGRH